VGQVADLQADNGNEIKDKENEMETGVERNEWEEAISGWLAKQDRQVLVNITERLIKALVVDTTVEVNDERETSVCGTEPAIR